MLRIDLCDSRDFSRCEIDGRLSCRMNGKKGTHWDLRTFAHRDDSLEDHGIFASSVALHAETTVTRNVPPT